ncbi:hypothetical protein AB0P17_17750 [Streptomyces sp. NPDC088124]|uniref:hypothetical protein n=1 Tax=Streptomyces sp. NPDC088124 TaxID=3154654 RepID=UPI00341CD0E3
MTTGDSSVAEAWKTSTLTFWPPGGDGRDNVVGAGSGYGLAVAALEPSSDAARAPAARAAATPRLALLALFGLVVLVGPGNLDR